MLSDVSHRWGLLWWSQEVGLGEPQSTELSLVFWMTFWGHARWSVSLHFMWL